MQINLKQILTLLLHRWYVLLIAAFLGGVIAVGVYLASTPTFMVTASLMLRAQDDKSRPTDDMLRIMGFSGTNNVQDEVEILSSRRIYGDAIRELGLQIEQRHKNRFRWEGEYGDYYCRMVVDPMMLDSLREIVRIDTRYDGHSYQVEVRYGPKRIGWRQKSNYSVQEGESINTIIGPIRIQGNETKPYRLRTFIYPMSVAIMQMQRNVEVESVSFDSNIVTFSVETDMPRRMEDFLSRVIDLYNTFSAQDKNVLAGQSAVFIAERLNIVEQQLDSIEQAVEQYRKEHLITDLSQEGALYMQASQNYENRMSDLRTQMRLIEYIRAFLQDETEETALIPANLGVQDGSLQTLIVDYNHLVIEHIRLSQSASENNPVYMQQQEQIAQMRRNILKSLDGQKEGLEISMANLQAQQREWESKIGDVPTQEREYVELRRQQQLKENQYLYLSQKREESAVMLAAQALPAKVIDYPAQLPQVVRPKPLMLLLKWVILSLLIASMGVLWYDRTLLTTA